MTGVKVGAEVWNGDDARLSLPVPPAGVNYDLPAWGTLGPVMALTRRRERAIGKALRDKVVTGWCNSSGWNSLGCRREQSRS